MKVSEIRIGNLIQISRYIKSNEPPVIKIYPIEQIGKDENGGYYYIVVDGGFCCNIDTGIRPIPLTEEWLLKFGFKIKTWVDDSVTGATHQRIEGDKILEFKLHYSCDWWHDRIYGHCSGYTPIKHVHSLQNLYFALTGEELF